MTSQPNDTAAKVTTIIAEKLSLDKNTIKTTVSLKELGADSLDLVEIVMKLEEAFGIEIADDDLANLHTIQDYAAYVQQKRSK